MKNKLIFILILTIVLCTYSEIATGAFGGEGAFGSVINYLKKVATSIIPSKTSTYDLGTAAKTWKTIYVDTITSSGLAPTDADYLVGTANGDLSAEIVVGTTPGGSLGGTWATPSIDDLFILNSTADTMTGNLTITSTDPAIILDEATATDTDFWLGNISDSAGDDDDTFQIGDGTTVGTNPFLTIDTSGNVGIGTTIPGFTLNIVSGGNIGIGTTQWNSSDKLDGTKIKDADYGDVTIDAAGDWDVENAQTTTTNANLTGEVTSVGNAATIADSVTVTGWTMGASAATTPGANDNDTSLATTAFCETTQDYLKTSENADVTVSDTAYDVTSWDANTDAATKNAIRDKIETIGGGGENLATTLGFGADANDVNITSLAILEFFDAGLNINGSADGVLSINTDGTLAIATADWDISTTGAITNCSLAAADNVIEADTCVGNAGSATVATTVTITDNEATAENNPIVFVAGADPDGGNLGLETDGTTHYNPSTGTITATQFVGGGAGLTAVDAATGDSATDFFDAGEIVDARISDTLTSSTCTGNAATVTNATLTTALTVNTGAVTLVGNVGASALTLGLGASSISGSNTGDDSGTDDQTIDVFSISGNNVQLSLESDGEATKTVDISTITAVAANTAKVTDDDIGVAEVYDATGWNADTGSPQKNDVRDKVEIMVTAIGLNTDKTTESTSVTTPITLNGVSVGIVNQGTTTQVLHGNAAGNASFGAIVSGDITDGTVTEADLNATNAPGAGEDNYILSYNHAGTNFTWAADAGGAEINNLETVCTNIATTEIFIGNAANAGVYAALSSEATMDNAGAVTLADSVAVTSWNLTTPTITGAMASDIQLGETDIKLDAVLSGDAKWSGIVIAGTSGVTTLAVGDLCYLDDDGEWKLTDANLSDGYDKMLGICVLAGADGNPTEMLIYGKVRSAVFPAFTVGSPVYMSETAGDVTHTQPTTTDACIRIMGFAITAEDFLFNPSNDYITHTG